MRALVTGCCGLIGSHLCGRLVADGWEVVGVDDQSVGTWQPGGIDFLLSPLASLDLHGVPHEFDVIFHLAARLGPAQVIADPLSMLSEGYEDTRSICEFAAEIRAVLVLASSSEVYQYNERQPYREDDPTLIGPSCYPRTGYAVGKLMVEHLGLAYHRQRGVKAIITRFFNVVGKRQATRFVLPILARQALSGERMTIHGDGQQRRTFTYVSDAASALIALAANPEAVGQVVNVGASEPNITMETAARSIRAHCHARYGVPMAPLDFVSYATTKDPAWEAMRNRMPDVAKLEALTGLRFGNRWDEIVQDVCADQWARCGGVVCGKVQSVA